MATTHVKPGARKTRKVGPSPSETETSVIPVEGNHAHLGAAKYLSVIAYPIREEWSDRNKFVEACIAYSSKLYVRRGGDRRKIKQKYLQARPRDIDSRIRMGIERIRKLRLPAAWIAIRIMLRCVEGPIWCSGPENIAQGVKMMQDFIGKPNNKRDAELCSFYNRMWAESLPVIHLAVPIHWKFLELLAEGKELQMIADPSWLPSAMRNAEALREYIPQFIHTFDPRSAIRLVPE